MKNTIRQFYFYTATLIFLIMSVIATISLLNLGMKTYLFPKAEMAYSPCDMSYMRAPAVEGTKQPTEEEINAQQASCEKNRVEERSAQRQSTFVQYLSMLLVTAPLFWIHFRWVQKEREAELKMGDKA